MSLILEALKKSERQRRLGESPSIGSPIMAVRRRRSILPILVVLIAALLGTLWWFNRGLLAPLPAPVAASKSSPAPVVEQKPIAPSIPDATTFDDAVPPESNVREIAQSSAPARQTRGKTPPADAQNRRPDLDEKLKSGELVVANSQALKPGEPAIPKESEAVIAQADPKGPPGRDVESSALVLGVDAAVKTRPASKPAGETQPGKPKDATPAPTEVAATAAPLASAAVGEQIKLMWELPYATRRELPEIKLSMHVFATEPDQRFVIINGTRQVEGDEVEGLKLIEIRSDGVVFEHEDVQFLFPRGGR